MPIDRKLNYGRDVIAGFLKDAAPFRVVLDLGAGLGPDLDAAREACPEADRHAVECHAPFRERLETAGITVHALDLERDRLPFGDGSIDVVIANQVFEHVKDVFWMLHEATRVLRPGGRLIVGVPNLASLHNRVLLSIGRQPSVIQNHSAHLRGYTRRDFTALLQAGFPGGYAPQCWAGSNFYPFPPWCAKPLAVVLPGLAWGLFMMFERGTGYSDGFLRYPVEQKLQTKFYLGQ